MDLDLGQTDMSVVVGRPLQISEEQDTTRQINLFLRVILEEVLWSFPCLKHTKVTC